jgi:hypothetical protein
MAPAPPFLFTGSGAGLAAGAATLRGAGATGRDTGAGILAGVAVAGRVTAGTGTAAVARGCATEVLGEVPEIARISAFISATL